MRSIPILSAVLLGAVLQAPSLADTIYLNDGEAVEARVVIHEGLQEVLYKDKGNKERAVPTSDVARIEYDGKPDLLQEADLSVADGDIGQALYELDLFLSGVLEGNDGPVKKFPWSPAYAAARIVELQQSQEAHDAVVAAADRLLANFADTRYMPIAWLAKARAHNRAGREAEALAALDAFEAVIEEGALDESYAQRAELARLQYDGGLAPKARLAKLEALAEEVDGVPAVSSPTQLALGEVRLVLADVDSGKRDDHLAAAEGHFESAMSGETVEQTVLAGASAGLGDVLYLRATRANDVEGLAKARKQYMRVVVLYPEQGDYAPRAMYFAALASKDLYDLTQDPADLDKQRKLAQRVRSRYRGSKWAEDARSLLR